MIVFKPDKQVESANLALSLTVSVIAALRTLPGFSGCLKLVSIVWVAGCVSTDLQHRTYRDLDPGPIAHQYPSDNEELISRDKSSGDATCPWQLQVDDYAQTTRK